MWWDWIVGQVKKHTGFPEPSAVPVVCRTKDGREFAPFSIEWRGSTLILCENEEAE